ncbi:MAG: M48 family metalloprotease [Solirubrobacterales bacterium]
MSRRGLVRLGAVAIAAVLVAEGAVWLLRPAGAAIAPAAVAEEAYFSAAELARAAEFRDVQRLIGLAALAVQGGVLVTVAVWRPAGLRRLLRGASRRPLLGGAAVGAGIALTLAVAALPLGALAHSRAEDVGLSTQTLAAWLGDRGRSAGVSALLAALGGALAVALLRRLRGGFWIGASAFVVAGAVVLIWLAPVLLAPLFNRFEPLPEGRARAEVLALAERAGVDVGEVYRVDASRRSTALNAYVGGIGTTKRVVLYDNALRELPPGELRAVVAHELAHVDERDILRGLAFVALVTPLGMLFVQLSAAALARRRGDDLRTPAGLPALALATAATAFVLGVPGNQLSRAMEARADTYALELTGDPKAQIGLHRRLAIANISDPSPPPILHTIFATHPTTIERIGAAVASGQASTQR